MRKTTKTQNLELPIIDPKVIDAARGRDFRPRPVERFPCRICNTAGATKRSDGLCWVCSRLKISAWRDWEAQESTLE